MDGDSVTIRDGDETTTLQLTSGVRHMHILEDCQTDKDSGIVGATSDMEAVTTGQLCAKLCVLQCQYVLACSWHVHVVGPELHFAATDKRPDVPLVQTCCVYGFEFCLEKSCQGY